MSSNVWSEARNITYAVRDRQLVAEASVRFGAGQLHLIVGPNGAGKSTLIKLLAGFLRPSIGSVRYSGTDVADIRETELAKHRAVLSQAVEVSFPLTVRELVMMGRYPHFGGRPGKWDEETVDEMMEFFDVGKFSGRNYQTLSGGERQRVNFARVLAQLWPAKHEHRAAGITALSGRYLFLDEPLTFLDIRHQIDFMKKIKAFAGSQDVVTVGVVHDLNLAARFADRIVLMDDGKIAAAGTPAEVLTTERIREVFGVEATFLSAGHSDLHLVFD